MESPDVSKVPNDGSIVLLRRYCELDESDAGRAFRSCARVGCCGANRIASRHGCIAADRLWRRYPETEANAFPGVRAPKSGRAKFTSGPNSALRSRPTGRERAILFEKGKAEPADLSPADNKMNSFTTKTVAGMVLFGAGHERYEFPQSVVFGG